MKKETISPKQQNNVAYLKETPSERMLFGFMKIVLGIVTTFAIITVCTGIGKFGFDGFFKRMQNTVHSFSPEFYNIRTAEFDENTMIVGSGSKETTADDRTVAACLKMDQSKNCLMPGAFGTTTFYIIPNKPEKDLDVHLEFNVCGLIQTDDGEYVKLSDMNDKISQTAEDLLDGHILFFTENDSSYSGLIKDGEMTYNTAEHHDDLTSDGEYKVTVYWIWPEYYEQLVDTNVEGAIITDSLSSAEMKDYIAEHQDEFFFKGDEQTEEPGKLYDNADLFIHQNVDFYGFEIIALN